MSFEALSITRQFINALDDMGITIPTEIQQKAIPQIINGQDVVGVAQTGTGKTVAFLLPLLMKIKYAQGMHPRALILAPTRELAMQIHDNLRQLTVNTDIRSAAVYGGAGIKAQEEAVAAGVDLIVATPGRMVELYSRGVLILKLVKTLVLDEADRMMDMGFMPQIRRILEIVPTKRQNLLFSATMPEKVERLMAEFVENPITIEVTPDVRTADTVTHYVYHVPNFRTKVHLLQHLLANKEEFNRVIIFTSTKTHANNIFNFITRKIADDVRVLHANKDQNARINAINAFRDGEVRILVGTDVVARGIDVAAVSHVINFDVPTKHEDYVHRIGRTGRATAVGTAITFVNQAEEYHIAQIEKYIKSKIGVRPIPDGVPVVPTPKEEQIEMERSIDEQKRRDDPTFKGAFHEKKERPHMKKSSKGKPDYKPKRKKRK